jgi:hypothetical protein
MVTKPISYNNVRSLLSHHLCICSKDLWPKPEQCHWNVLKGFRKGLTSFNWMNRNTVGLEYLWVLHWWIQLLHNKNSRSFQKAKQRMTVRLGVHVNDVVHKPTYPAGATHKFPASLQHSLSWISLVYCVASPVGIVSELNMYRLFFPFNFSLSNMV